MKKSERSTLGTARTSITTIGWPGVKRKALTHQGLKKLDLAGFLTTDWSFTTDRNVGKEVLLMWYPQVQVMLSLGFCLRSAIRPLVTWTERKATLTSTSVVMLKSCCPMVGHQKRWPTCWCRIVNRNMWPRRRIMKASSKAALKNAIFQLKIWKTQLEIIFTE